MTPGSHPKPSQRVNPPPPYPPQWAIDAGLPLPGENEGFVEYVRSLGLDPAPLLEGLNERTAPLVNGRLHTLLQRELPDAFSAHVSALVDEHVPEERRDTLRRYQT